MRLYNPISKGNKAKFNNVINVKDVQLKFWVNDVPLYGDPSFVGRISLVMKTPGDAVRGRDAEDARFKRDSREIGIDCSSGI